MRTVITKQDGEQSLVRDTAGCFQSLKNTCLEMEEKYCLGTAKDLTE